MFDIVKWPVLVVLVSLMLAILYYAVPEREAARRAVDQPGRRARGRDLDRRVGRCSPCTSANFGSYNKTYGTLASVIIFLVWLWLTNLAILLGAEFNAELQHARAIAGRAPPDSDDVRRAARHPQAGRRHASAGHRVPPETDQLKAYHSLRIGPPAIERRCT